MTNPITPLAMRPPIIVAKTEMTDPEHYDGGISIAAVAHGLQVAINAWFNIAYYDLVEMFWGDDTYPVWKKVIDRAEELTEGVRFTIPTGFVIEGDANPVFYRVTRLNQVPEDSEPVAIYLVQLKHPGGKDNDGEGNGNPGLKYSFTPDISGGVTSNIANRGVQMRIEPYLNMARFDSIAARWGNEKVEHYPVTQQQIDDPGKYPIVLNFTKEIIGNAGSGPGLLVSFQVRSRCGNYPDPKDPWAKTTAVPVDLDDHRLDTPDVLIKDQPVDTIELDALGGGDVTVRVNALSPDFAPNDLIQMTWAGTPAVGDPVIVGPLDKTVGALPAAYDFTIPNVMVKAIAKGWASVNYVRVRAGVADQPSKTASLNVKGEIPQLLAPSVKEANGTQLNPMQVQQKLVVMLPQGSLLPTDKVSVSWLAADGTPAAGSHTTLTRPVSESGVEIEIPVLVIAYNLGKSVTVIYSVTRGTAAPKDSLPLLLNVLPIAASEFKGPIIREAENNGQGPALDLSAGAIIRIPVWPHIAERQYVWLALEGQDAAGHSHDLTIWNQPSHASVNLQWISLGYYDVAVRNDYLIGLGNNTKLHVHFKASLSKSQDESSAQTFEVRTYTVKAMEQIKPTIVSVKGAVSGQDIPSGSFTTETRVTLTGMASGGQHVDIRDGGVVLGHPVADLITRIWTHEINNLSLAPHSLTATVRYGSGETSAAWKFTAMEQLAIDRQPMILKGLSVKMPEWPPTGNDSIGNTEVRQPTKGLPPYSYASSDSTVASVSSDGKVTGNKNGSAFIVVLDSGGQSATYRVLVSNVYYLRLNKTPMTVLEAIKWKESLENAIHCFDPQIADLQLVYGVNLPLQGYVWICNLGGCSNAGKSGAYINGAGILCVWDTAEYAAWCAQPA